MSLAGFWQFQLDPTDSGVRQDWFNRRLPNSIKLPGILQAQNFGNVIGTDTPWVLSLYDHFWFLRDDYKAYVEPGKTKVPFLSQPPRHYLGAAWYQRDLYIQPSMSGRRLVLTLERPHWGTMVWVDARLVGTNASLVAPHEFDLGNVSPGLHRLTIRVDNRMLLPYRPDAHSVSDSLGATWNGIAGKIEINDTGRVWIDNIQAFPDLNAQKMRIKVRIGNATGRSGQGTLTAIWPDIGVVPVSWNEQGGTAEVEVPLRPDAEKWDEFNPKLHKLRIWLKAADVDESKEVTIGLRDFHAEGNQFVLNGHPINFRGTHHGGDFPLTGYPPTDLKEWRALFELCKKWGLNHMRFHSWCPPEAAFEAADQIGFYLQPEPGMWNEISPGTPIERMLYEETDRMIAAYGNHPSFMLLSASNEPKGKWQESLSNWVAHYHQQDSRRLYVSGTGHTERTIDKITEGTDFLAIQRIGPLMLRRESAWFGGDFRQSLAEVNIPVISHEVGQWVAYPDYEVIKKFTGYLRPGNFEIFRDSMVAHGLIDQNTDFARASGKFQLECYKEEIEGNLRTPGLGGFQLLDLHDYLGQGTALVGLLDPFWESKGYVSANEFKQFCNTTVPLARMRRVFTSQETLTADVEVAHFGAAPIEDAVAVWRIGSEEKPIARGEWRVGTIPIGKNFPLGRLVVDLATLKSDPAAAGLFDNVLTVTVAPAQLVDGGHISRGPRAVRGSTYFENQWHFWVFPPATDTDEPRGSSDCPISRAPEYLITRSWEEAETKLLAGDRVLFVPRNVDLDWSSPPLDTVPVFWNRQMGPAWGRMLGIFVNRSPADGLQRHALNSFLTASNFDWQWASIIPNVRALNLDRLPSDLKPVVWGIDDWNRNYKLGLIFECAVGQGRLLVSAFDITKANDSNPVGRQLRRSLINYIASDCFQPRVAVTTAELRTLFFDTRIMKKLGAAALAGGQPAGELVDGDPNTFILVGDQKSSTRDPLDFVLSFPAPVAMSGVVLMPRQNHREHEGDTREFTLEVSDDGQVWRVVRQGERVSTFAPQRIELPGPITTRYLKFSSLSGFGTDKTAALAELAVIYAGPELRDDGTIEYQRNRTATPEIDEPVAKPSPSATPVRRPRF